MCSIILKSKQFELTELSAGCNIDIVWYGIVNYVGSVNYVETE